METTPPPKRRFNLVLHGTHLQKTSLIDTAVKAFQKTGLQILIMPLYGEATERRYREMQRWNDEDGDGTFSETSVQPSATRYKVPEDKFCLLFIISIVLVLLKCIVIQ
jgi:hypothetical protein